MRCLASLPAPFGAVRWRRHHPRVLPRRLPRSAGAPRTGLGRRRRHLAALQPRHPLPVVRRHAAPPGLPALDAALARRRSRACSPPTALSSLTSARSQPIPGPGWTWRGWPAGVFTLQNTIHWIKSIAIDRDAAGGAALDRDLAVGHYKPINSARFVNDCHEYVFHFTRHGETALDRTAIGVPYQDKSNVTRWARGRQRPAVPRQHVVPSLRHDQEPRQGSSAPGDVPAAPARAVHPAARPRSRPPRGRSRSPGWAARRSPARASTSTSPGSTWTTCI